MALLGTSLSTEHLMRASQFDAVFICLDKDATDKAVAIHRRLSAFVDRCTVVMLSSDIKDMEEQAIGELFIDTSNQGAVR
jgi:DNA primase